MEESKVVIADVLDEDKPIANQKFVCLSFLSPEKIIQDKNLFFFNEFVKTWEYTKSIECFNSFVGFMSYKYNLNATELQQDLKEFIVSEKEKLSLNCVKDDYKTFLDNNEETIQEKFNIEHKFKTNVRGIKVRGSYNTQQEAEMRAKMLREFDPNHDVYVGQVGMWMPFDPDAYKTGNVQYLEKELNELMHEKNKNDESAKEEFNNRIKESKEKAIEDNIKKAENSGNVLSQVMDEETGDLRNLRAVDWNSVSPDEINREASSFSNDVKKEILNKMNKK
jgi:hypothetical protein